MKTHSFSLVCDSTPVHATQSNSVLLFSALLLLDPAHMGRAEKGELQVASRELRFICHSHHRFFFVIVFGVVIISPS